tara:strand:- start:4536 stop:6791 length:2256 start_codon:yes stop_codon:yes gene_type:complete
MAYKFQRGDATYSGSLTIDEDLSVTEAITGTTSITAGTSFIIGSADLNEADMEKIDGITNGTAAASKAIVLDADKGITGISTLTASYFKGDGSALTGISSDNVDVADTTSDLNYQLVAVTASGDGVSLVTMNTAAQRVTINGSTGKMILDGPGIQIGAADITEAEFEFLDGATAGSVVNSKAVVYSAAGKVQGTTFLGPDDVTIGGATVNDFITIGSDEVTFKDGNYKVNVASHDGASYGLELAGTLVTSTAAELNLVDGSGAGNVVNSKAAIYDAGGHLNATQLSSSFGITGSALTLGGTAVTSTAAELNLVDGSSAGTVVNSKAVIYSAAGVVQGTDFKGPDGFDIGNASVADMIKLNAAEVVFKDGNYTVDIASADAASYGLKLAGTLITSTAAELNLVDGSSAGTVVNSKVPVYDGGGHLNATQLSSSFGISGSALTLGGTAVGASANDLNLAQGMAQSTGTAVASAFIALDEHKSVTGINNLTASFFSGDGSGLNNVSADANGSDKQVQFNQNGEFKGDSGLTYDGSGSLDLVEADASSIGLKLAGTLVTATAAELNYLDITTLGTAAASKALTIKGDNTWTVAGMTCANLGTVTTLDINGGTIDGTTIGVASAAVVTASYLAVNGNVDLGNGSDVVNVNGRLDFGEGASANMQTITSNDTLAERDFYNIVSGSSAITVTLPGNSGLTDGTIFYIKRGFGMTNNVTISVNNEEQEMIDGDHELVLESTNAAVQLFWDSTSSNWHVF